MIKTLIGIVLFLSPLLLLARFNGKKIGFAYILSFMIFFHLILALITQLFGIFSYAVILIANLAVFFIVLRFSNFRNFRKINLKKVDFVMIAVILISFVSLFSVHYNYTGEYTVLTTTEYQYSENLTYQYPYFSDEWQSISFIKYSFDTGKLPFVNPFLADKPFRRVLQFGTFSLSSEVMMILSLDPLNDFVVVSVFVNILVILLIYLFLRFNKVEKLPASLACLTGLYIANGVSFPTIWNLLPFSYALIVFILSLFFISINNEKMLLLLATLMLVFYPPIFIFYILGYFIRKKSFKDVALHIVYIGIIELASLFIFHSLSYLFVFFGDNLFAFVKGVFLYYFDKLFFVSSSGEYFVPYLGDYKIKLPIFMVLPWIVLVFSALGIFSTIKRKFWLFSTLALALFSWILYSFISFRIIMSYQRVVYLACVLLVIYAGFGLDFAFRSLKKNKFFINSKIMELAMIFALILLFISPFIGYYTSRDNWKEFKAVLKTDFGEIAYLPAAPANIYLKEDDLRLFKDIHNVNFLSHPWKGLVIGTASDNYPVCSKSGIFNINEGLYSEFMEQDCNKKSEIARNYNVTYVYSSEFACPGFEEVGRSEEGFVLYKVS
ncbi:MAG: hypothetical protein ABIH72_05580 [archaeon]